MAEDQFLFDDFFVAQDDSDPGERVEVELRGRKVPIFLKRGLSFGDKQAAKSKAVQTRVKPNGQVEIVSVDEGTFAVELLLSSIKSWPFVYASGKRVPVTRENIRAMLGDCAEVLAKVVVDRITARDKKMAPFTKPSEQISADLC